MRPSILNPLFAPITSVSGVGPKLGHLVARFCGDTISDVLWHLPSDVIHRPVLSNSTDILIGSYATLLLYIDGHVVPHTRRSPYRIKATGFNRPFELVFFNYHKSYLSQKFPVSSSVWVSGKLDRQGLGFQILHPDYVATTHTQIPEFEVIYPQSRGVSSKLLHHIATSTLSKLSDLPEWLDPPFQTQHQLPSWKQALILAHTPHTSADLQPDTPARFRLAYDEILANQLALLLVRQNAKKQSGKALIGTGKITQKLSDFLPFQLTSAQQHVIAEIQQDLSSPTRMTRLLQGDVGSGKTIVALFAMMTAVESGAQSALMAPTDILARQHFDKISRLCEPLGITVGLLTGRDKGKTRSKILSDLKTGDIQLIIGTHALFTDTVDFNHLGLVIIDEQHKFGVHQRLSLVQKEQGTNLLVMTATPIPRSLALTAYGDMDISRLDEKPIGRTPIETRVLSTTQIPMLIQRLYAKINTSATRPQAYWICPLVEESESSDLTAVKHRFDTLQKTFGDRVGLIHGQMTGAEKDAVMTRFSAGELDVLVATTVIEVGIDVPTATLMIIEQAERFGLAGLHQLRGRVGRGSEKSLCLLLHSPHITQTAQKRLAIMREIDDGFLLAEEDLKLRGAGEMLGAKQSGLISFKMADPIIQNDLIWTATQDARTILTLDPHLTTPRGQALRLLLYLFRKDSELQTLKAG